MKKLWFCVFGLLVLHPFASMASNKAGLVIRNSTGDVITRCVEFDEEMISVEALLQRSGFQLITGQTPYGTLIDYLHDDGVPAGENHPAGWFWNFYQNDGTSWIISDVGVSLAEARDGTLFGFVFGAWNEVKPPQKSFTSVCNIVSKAGLVIDHSDGRRVMRVVEFFGETIPGDQLLFKSGLALITSKSTWGTSFCSIDGEGMPVDNCFGDPKGRYWGFNILADDDSWYSSPVGVNSVIVYDGDVHGFFYATWGTPQPVATRAEVFNQTTSVSDWALLR